MAGISLVSLNIEQDKHDDELVLPFLKRVQPDVLCLQEVREPELPKFKEIIGEHCVFAPLALFPTDAGMVVQGQAIISHMPFTQTDVIPYGKYRGDVREIDRTSYETRYASMRFSLAIVRIEKDGKLFRIATTHFPLTQAGEASDFQREALSELLEALGEDHDVILCGDFNAPRGGAIFGTLAERFTDNIPARYATSLDLSIHRNGKDRPHELADKMVDVLFTTPNYRATDVSLVSGVSDHCAVSATIE